MQKKKKNSKKEVEGYYFDGKKSWILYKDERGKSIMVRDKKKTLEDKNKKGKK
jgi:hypothetical protein